MIQYKKECEKMSKKQLLKTNAIRKIEQQKIPYQLHEYAWNEQQLDAIHVAKEMGVTPEEVFKTLVLHGDKTGYLVVCIPAFSELNLKLIAKLSHNKKVELVPVNDLEKITGYIRGGCSPIGMKKVFPTFIEESAKHHLTIRISAGKRGLQVELNPNDLQQLTKATWFLNHKE